MKTLTLEYKSDIQLNNFIIDNSFINDDNLLIQIFTAINDEKFILALTTHISSLLPDANIIGTTTCGEISNKGSLTNSTVISFSTFKDTKIKTTLMQEDTNSFDLGQNIIKYLEGDLKEEIKIIISFTDGLYTNGEEYLNGISSINNDVIVSGGMAGDNSKFKKTLVFTQNSITNNGAVAVGLYNQKLNVATDYSYNWEAVGKKHIVEKSVKNRVYKISGRTPVDFYAHYLGRDISRLLPAIGIEFPLIMQKDGFPVARAILAKHDDGSLSFAGNIPEGSIVQFGHGDVEMIINKGVENIKHLIDNPVESIFIYSCMARRALLQHDVNLEILPLSEIAPISGFFTYGEFYHNEKTKTCKNSLLNQTMTIVAISEKDNKIQKISPNIFSHNPRSVDDIKLHRTQALSSLIDQTTKELEDLNKTLEQRVKTEVAKNLEKDTMLHIMQSQAQIGEMMEMIIHQWRQPISAITTAISSIQVYKESDMLTDSMLEESLNNILSYSELLNSTIEDFRELFKSGMSLKETNTEVLIKKSLTIITPLLQRSDVKLEEEYKSNTTINISIGLLMQVILNIVKNSIDALIEKNIENKIVKFRTYNSNKFYIIEIHDNGGGIPLNILPRVFDKRFTTKGEDNGTGIGLDMSKTIIESKLNGKITAHNNAGWAVFTIKIPLA